MWNLNSYLYCVASILTNLCFNFGNKALRFINCHTTNHYVFQHSRIPTDNWCPEWPRFIGASIALLFSSLGGPEKSEWRLLVSFMCDRQLRLAMRRLLSVWEVMGRTVGSRLLKCTFCHFLQFNQPSDLPHNEHFLLQIHHFSPYGFRGKCARLCTNLDLLACLALEDLKVLHSALKQIVLNSSR